MRHRHNKESAEILKKRIQSFEAMADNIESRIRRSRDVIARDIKKATAPPAPKEGPSVAQPQEEQQALPQTQESDLPSNDFSLDFGNSFMDNNLDLFGDPYLS